MKSTPLGETFPLSILHLKRRNPTIRLLNFKVNLIQLILQLVKPVKYNGNVFALTHRSPKRSKGLPFFTPR